jgi:hypothetical protein
MHKKFFTVEYESGGRRWHQHVEAYDSFEATKIVMASNRSAIWSKVVREIDRAEYQRLTQ